MALTVRTNGSSPSNIINASWFNDYYNLLTGAMNDQPVTIKYVPGAGASPALTLISKAGNPLLLGFKPDGVTQAFKFDENGNLGMTSFVTSAVSVLNPASGNYDAVNLGNSHDATYLVPMGSADPTFFLGAGFYVYDSKNNGPIMYGGTKNGLTINGTLTLGSQGGNVLVATAAGAGYGQIYWHSKDNLTPEFSWTMDSRPASPLAMQIARQGVNGFTFLDIFHIDLNGNITSPAGAGIPMTRNGSAVSVALYSGSTTPTGNGTTTPATGAVWAKA